MPTISTGPGDGTGVTIHYEDTAGPGRPVVLIHGWPLSGAAWTDNVPDLAAAGYRVVSYDRRVFGESEKPLIGYAYDSLSEPHGINVSHREEFDRVLVDFLGR
jgi:pimeloyl-ACP methyl ester carboxylesterase